MRWRVCWSTEHVLVRRFCCCIPTFIYALKSLKHWTCFGKTLLLQHPHFSAVIMTLLWSDTNDDCVCMCAPFYVWCLTYVNSVCTCNTCVSTSVCHTVRESSRMDKQRWRHKYAGAYTIYISQVPHIQWCTHAHTIIICVCSQQGHCDSCHSVAWWDSLGLVMCSANTARCVLIYSAIIGRQVCMLYIRSRDSWLL